VFGVAVTVKDWDAGLVAGMVTPLGPESVIVETIGSGCDTLPQLVVPMQPEIVTG
jgi:hypothetical protein